MSPGIPILLLTPIVIIMKLFYADDDSEDREIFCDAIRQINPEIKVVLSKDGQEALEILNADEQLPDFIFLDINMPRMNGIECMAKLKSNVHLRSIPIIIYSTTSSSSEVKKMIMLGAEEFIPKVYSVEKLVESLQNVLFGEHLVVH